MSEELNIAAMVTLPIVQQFVAAFDSVQYAVFQNAVQHGWWEPPAWKVELGERVRNSESYLTNAEFRADFEASYSRIPDYNPSEKIALMHTELAEVTEGLRTDNKSDKLLAFTAEEEELADVIIRAMDYAGRRNLRLSEAILAKHAYNLTRPYKHNKAF